MGSMPEILSAGSLVGSPCTWLGPIPPSPSDPVQIYISAGRACYVSVQPPPTLPQGYQYLPWCYEGSPAHHRPRGAARRSGGTTEGPEFPPRPRPQATNWSTNATNWQPQATNWPVNATNWPSTPPTGNSRPPIQLVLGLGLKSPAPEVPVGQGPQIDLLRAAGEGNPPPPSSSIRPGHRRSQGPWGSPDPSSHPGPAPTPPSRPPAPPPRPLSPQPSAHSLQHGERRDGGFPRPSSHTGIDLSYISTDRFWTQLSTANLQVAFSPLGAHLFIWDSPFYIQSHQIFPIPKICGSVNQEIRGRNVQVRPGHQLAERSEGRAPGPLIPASHRVRLAKKVVRITCVTDGWEARWTASR